MKTDRVTIRLGEFIMKGLEQESEKRGQTVASLVRGYILDGLGNHYDARQERLFELVQDTEARLKIVETLVASNLDVTIAHRTVDKTEKISGESAAEYGARLKANYRASVKGSFENTGFINQAAQEYLQAGRTKRR